MIPSKKYGFSLDHVSWREKDRLQGNIMIVPGGSNPVDFHGTWHTVLQGDVHPCVGVGIQEGMIH